MSSSKIDQFESILTRVAPYMSTIVSKARTSFGFTWEQQFDETLQKLFSDNNEKLEDAIKGYVRFALDATKLQKRFEKEKIYIPKSYEEAANAVYHNKEYMNNLYLPGILLSQYLWPHHYRQLVYFHEKFIPLIHASREKQFCDVGVGTGFYSRQILSTSNQIRGKGFDISEHSLNYATMHIDAFGFLNRWEFELRDVLKNKTHETFQFLISVEVLEHLEDPVAHLKVLRSMLRSDGFGFIAAAITAPNADHIYLYNNCEEVLEQIKKVGFTVIDYSEQIAYEPKKSEPVPRMGLFIVQ
tara:strand:+ start:790 stop:1686 length:897 start_codon:yes stop_codon:yes gene_type:complete